MGRSNNSFIKKQKADRRVKRKKEKMEERLERKEQSTSGKLENMIAYIDEFGNISDTPPEEPVPAKKNKDSREPQHSKGNQN